MPAAAAAAAAALRSIDKRLESSYARHFVRLVRTSHGGFVRCRRCRGTPSKSEATGEVIRFSSASIDESRISSILSSGPRILDHSHSKADAAERSLGVIQPNGIGTVC